MTVTSPITKQEQQVFHDYKIPVHESLAAFTTLADVPTLTGTFEGANVNVTDLLEDYVAAQLDFNRLVDIINQAWWGQLQTWHKITGDRLAANTKAHLDAFMPFEQERTHLAKDAEQGFPQQLLKTPREQWSAQDHFGYDYIMFQVDLKWEFFNILEIMATLNPGVDIEPVATEIQSKLAPKHGPQEHEVNTGNTQPEPADSATPAAPAPASEASSASSENSSAFPGQNPEAQKED